MTANEVRIKLRISNFEEEKNPHFLLRFELKSELLLFRQKPWRGKQICVLEALKFGNSRHPIPFRWTCEVCFPLNICEINCRSFRVWRKRENGKHGNYICSAIIEKRVGATRGTRHKWASQTLRERVITRSGQNSIYFLTYVKAANLR